MSDDAQMILQVKMRDHYRGIADAIDEFIASVDPYKPIKEDVFDSLPNWESKETQKLGSFQVHQNNGSDAFLGAFTILNRKNATINDRFYQKDYAYSYWIYKGSIYRKKLQIT